MIWYDIVISRSALLEPMPLIEGSRSKNVLADSDSSSDLLNQASIPNGETVSVDKAKKSHNTEVSGKSYWCKVINNLKKKKH